MKDDKEEKEDEDDDEEEEEEDEEDMDSFSGRASRGRLVLLDAMLSTGPKCQN